MNAKQIVEHFGGKTRAAAALGVSRQTIHYWLKNGISPLRALDVELRIKGVVKQPRTRRPDRPGRVTSSDGIGVLVKLRQE